MRKESADFSREFCLKSQISTEHSVKMFAAGFNPKIGMDGVRNLYNDIYIFFRNYINQSFEFLKIKKVSVNHLRRFPVVAEQFRSFNT